MELKDIISLALAAIPAAVGVYKLFKDVSWFLPKASKYSYFIEKYKEYLDPLEVEFMRAEIKRDVKKSVLGIQKQKIRHLVLYIRTHSELTMSSWRWENLAPHIQQKYNRFFIRYNGKYRSGRIFSKFLAILYMACSLRYIYPWLIENKALSIPDVIFIVVFSYMSIFLWNLLPGRKVIKEYNADLLKIDASKYRAE